MIAQTVPARAALAAIALVALGSCGEALVEPKRTDFTVAAEWVAPTAPLPAAPPTPRSISVRVRGASGAPIRGLRVRFALEAGVGSLSVPSALTDAEGLATVLWTFGNIPGAQRVRAFLPEVTDSSLVTFEAEVVFGTETQFIASTTATSVAVGGADTLTLVVRDAVGNTYVPSGPFTYSSADSAVASVSGTGVVTGVGPGTTVVTVSDGTVSDTALIRVGSYAPTIQRASRYAPSTGGLVLNSSGTGFISGANLSGVWVFDASSLEVKSTLVTDRAEGEIALSADESRLYVAEYPSDYYGSSTVILEKSIATGVTLRSFNLPRHPRRLIASVDGSRLFAATTSGYVYSINLTDGSWTSVAIPGGGEISDLDVSVDGSLLAVAASSGVVSLLSPATLDTVRTASFSPIATGIAFSRLAPWLYVGRPDGTLLRVNTNTFAVEAESGITGISHTQPTDDRRYVVGIRTADNSVEILDATTLASLATESVGFPYRLARQPGSKAIWIFGGFNLLVRLILY